jgi:hypothetical protein
MTRYRRSVARVIIEQAFLPRISLIPRAREIEHSSRVALIGPSEMAWKRSRSEITSRLVITTPLPRRALEDLVRISPNTRSCICHALPASSPSGARDSEVAAPLPGRHLLFFEGSTPHK